MYPAASAGAILRVIIAEGKFHGVIAPTTPTGHCLTITSLSGVLAEIVLPYLSVPTMIFFVKLKIKSNDI